MGTLKLTKELLRNQELIQNCFNYMERNYNSAIVGERDMGEYVEYEIIGEGIPNRTFCLCVTSIVPGVLKIEIQ